MKSSILLCLIVCSLSLDIPTLTQIPSKAPSNTNTVQLTLNSLNSSSSTNGTTPVSTTTVVNQSSNKQTAIAGQTVNTAKLDPKNGLIIPQKMTVTQPANPPPTPSPSQDDGEDVLPTPVDPNDP